jgi:hypothetical protein
MGNDVLILPLMLDDERSLAGKVLPLMLIGASVSAMFMMNMKRRP